MNAYPGEFYLGEMPMMLQRFLFGPFGYVLRRFLGFKPHLRFADLQDPDLGTPSSSNPSRSPPPA